MYPTTFLYAQTHEWIEIIGNEGKIGITDHAQEMLGDIVYVELPKIGKKISAGETIGAVESVKAVSDLYAPMSGEVIEVHGELNDTPELVNEDPHGKGWMLKLKLTDLKETGKLLDASDYEKFAAEDHQE